MKLSQLLVERYFALVDQNKQIIKSGLTHSQVLSYAQDPTIRAKYGKLEVIIDPDFDNMLFKHQAGVNYSDSDEEITIDPRHFHQQAG